MVMSSSEWKNKYRAYRSIADSIYKSRITRAREVCRQAGLDPELLGIHPHNAMIAYELGTPWQDVDYHYVRLCIRLLESASEGHHIVDRWLSRVGIR